jgi:hypothetical protein
MKHPYQPPERVRRFVAALLTEESQGEKVKAEEISGVPRGNFYYHYKNNPDFREWFSNECTLFINTYEPSANSGLIAGLRRGDIQHIRTFFELKGKLRKDINIDQSKHTHTTYVWGTDNPNPILPTTVSDRNSQFSEAV